MSDEKKTTFTCTATITVEAADKEEAEREIRKEFGHPLTVELGDLKKQK